MTTPTTPQEDVVTITDPDRAAVTEPTAEPASVAVDVTTDQRIADNAVAQVERQTLDRAQKDAMDRVADAALAMPGNASVDEFMSMAVQARILSMSGAAPKAVKGNPHVALHLVMIGRDLGISASAAVELIDVIDTQQGLRPSLSPQLLNGQIRRLGLGSIVPAIQRDDLCVAVALDPGGRLDHRCKKTWPEHHDLCECRGIIGETEFSWAEAQTAGLAGENCTPTNHAKKLVNGKMRCGCNGGYERYPKRMMWWRSSGFCADDWFPEAGLGLYTAEELGALVDPNGRLIDASSVELPPGYELEGKTQGRQPGDPLTPDEQERADLCVLRVAALPEDGKQRVRDGWKNAQRLRGVKLDALPADVIGLAESLIRGAEQQCKTASKGDWTPEAALAGLITELQEAYGVPAAGPPVDGSDADPGAEGEVSRARDTDTDDPVREVASQAGVEVGPVPEVVKPDVVTQPQPKDDNDVLSDADPSKLTVVLKEVQNLKAQAVDDRLKDEFGIVATGNVDTRKRALVIAILRSEVAQAESGPTA